MDGSHMGCCPSAEDQDAAHNLRGFLTCSLHHRKFCFLYVAGGHEGSAADAHMYESVHVSDFCVPAGKYYLADAGFGSCDALLVPYHGVRYHSKEWGRADVQ